MLIEKQSTHKKQQNKYKTEKEEEEERKRDREREKSMINCVEKRRARNSK